MRILLILISLTVWGHSTAQNWIQLNDFPGASRDDGCSFVIDGKAYCGTGRDAGFQVTSDFYAFEMATEQWYPVASMPDSAKRQYAAATSFLNNGIVFGGIDNQGNYLNDLRFYYAFVNVWAVLTIPSPFDGRSGSQCFVIDSVFYAVGGRTANSLATKEVWAFDLVQEQWSQKSDFPGDGIWRGFAVAYDNYGIVGMGSDSTNTKRGEIYFYDPSTDTWTEMPQIETEPMSYPAVSVINDRLMVYGGEDTNGVYRNDFRYLDLTNLTWHSLSPFVQEARRGTMAFSSSSDFYISTGITTTQRLNETWVARNVASVEEETNSKELTVFVEEGVLKLSEPLSQCTLVNSMGQLIALTAIEPGAFRLPDGMSEGIYFCRGGFDNQVFTGKIAVQ